MPTRAMQLILSLRLGTHNSLAEEGLVWAEQTSTSPVFRRAKRRFSAGLQATSCSIWVGLILFIVMSYK